MFYPYLARLILLIAIDSVLLHNNRTGTGVQDSTPYAASKQACASMATNPLFTVTFDVKSGDKNYGEFIADLRRRLGNPGHFSHNRPVLPPFDQTVPPRWWFHIVLKTAQTTSGLTLAVRADNLYLEGFRSSDGTWWELTRGFIPGATYAGFGGSYGELFRDTAFGDLADVPLGPKHMADAVDALAAGVAPQKRAKEALLVVLLMVVEATRLVTVSELVAKLMHPKEAMKSGKIPAHMAAQVHGWQDLSKALLRTDAKFVDAQGGMTVEKTEKMKVKTVEEAAGAVGILLFVPGPEKVEGGMTTATGMRLFRGN